MTPKGGPLHQHENFSNEIYLLLLTMVSWSLVRKDNNLSRFVVLHCQKQTS